jgi:murein tripeptide amidase MpaA
LGGLIFACLSAAAVAGDAAHAPPHEWLTYYELHDYNETPRYAETIEYCRRLADASPWVRMVSFGTTPQGRDMEVLVLSRHGVFTPEATARADDLVCLVQNCIHAGECAGKDAALMLMRDIAITREHAALLDHVTLLVIPVFNVDGHERFGPYHRINQIGPREMGWRSTAQRLNLNRDYLKAETPEMRAELALWSAWNPDFHIDNHSTDGADYQYDVTYALPVHQEQAEPVRRWTTDTYIPRMERAMRADGHVIMPYAWLIDRTDPAQGVRFGAMSPRFSTGYGALRNRPSLLVETHVRKPYRVRVKAHYDIMLHTLEELSRDPDALRRVVRQADQQTVALGTHYDPTVRFPLQMELTDESEPFTFRGVETTVEPSDVSGARRTVFGTTPVDTPSKAFNQTRVTVAVAPPLGYLIPPEYAWLTELLESHGLRYERLTHAVERQFESYHFDDVKWAERPFEGHHLVTFTATPIRERRTYPAGSILVRLNQPGAKIALHLLEPDAPDSLAVWGFFDQIFCQIEYAEEYVLEDLARRMLAEDPRLKAEFEERLENDSAFRADPRARLYFFYRRSPWWDDRLNVYPIARVTEPLNVEG